ncbi:hypothetical protein V2J09_019784 [Rumex salicifolius]
MESLVVLPCKPRPSVFQIPQRTEPLFDLSTKTTKSLTLSVTRARPTPGISGTHLNFLLKSGRFNETIAALDEIAQCGLKIKANTYVKLLNYCIDFNLIDVGRELHARIEVVDSLETFVETKLVSLHAKCGRLLDARRVFDEMRERDLYTWSAMIGAYSREQRWKEVLELFGSMVEDGILPDHLLIPKILQACGNYGDYETGRRVHSLVIRGGMASCPRVCNALLAVYVKCGRFRSARRFFGKMDGRDTVSWNSIISGHCQRGESDEALRLFDMMCKEGIEPGLVTWNILISSYNQCGNCDAAMDLMRKMEYFGVVPDVFTWTSMISGLAQNNRVVQALELLREMLFEGIEPTGVTMTSAVSACASLKALESGKELHSLAIRNGFANNLLVENSLIDMYAKCGELDAARQVFDSMLEKDVYTWNSMIGGYCQEGYCGKAYGLFTMMQDSAVKPNVVTWNIILMGYIQNGDGDEAMDLFQKMIKGATIKPDTSSWNSIISAYLQIGEKDKALGIFRHMHRLSVRSNPVTILTVLPACANLVTAMMVKEIHASVLRRGLDSYVSVANCLIDSYAKSGKIAYSRAVFDSMVLKDVVTWNSLITGYVFHGRADDALDAIEEMKREGFAPNRGTFVSLLLACGLKKMVQKGKQDFLSMTRDYKIVPSSEHYSAMVTLLGRSGRLLEAVEFIKSMDEDPDLVVWDALLTASRFHGNAPLAVRACENLLELNPGNSIIYHLVSQAYNARRSSANINSLEECKPMRKSTTEKLIGCSLVEVNNMFHSFVSGDQPAIAFQQIHALLNSIAASVNALDYKKAAWVEEEESEESCGVHSEKLALAFSLVRSSMKGQPIRIVKNFRMCADCHNTFKYVSASYACEVVLNDSKCLHHFRSGSCSCGDYW